MRLYGKLDAVPTIGRRLLLIPSLHKGRSFDCYSRVAIFLRACYTLQK